MGGPKIAGVVGRRLRPVLIILFGLFGLIAANSLYLLAVRAMQVIESAPLQDSFYQNMFLLHLVLGLCLIPPFLIYVPAHFRRAAKRANRNAIRAGIAVAATGLGLLLTGLLLTRGIPGLEIKSEFLREIFYWLHVVAFGLVVWLFVLHRLAGRPVRWRLGAGVVAASLAMTIAAAGLFRSTQGNEASLISFPPSLAKLKAPELIEPAVLMRDEECGQCHADTHERWAASAHRFASFNNPAYRFSVERTRDAVAQRDGSTQAARFCAGCHDLVPLFSGQFDHPDFDQHAVGADAGVNCLGCHAITSVDSVRGNADYTLEPPPRYPFAAAQDGPGRWVNHLLIRANPQLHKSTMLRPVHESAEFCGACHKVHLPESLNAYRWLRGQNHYDSYLLSGVSGHGASSFYYPDSPEDNCNGCHMPLMPSDDFGAIASSADPTTPYVHDHFFPGANTALAPLMGLAEWPIEAHQALLTDSVSLDLFGIKRGGQVSGELVAPLALDTKLERGKTYLLELVVRTRTLGHWLTQGTADSNQLWLEVELSDADGMIGHSGWIDQTTGEVDPWAHRVNSYVVNAQGERIDRRNPEDIHTTLYNHQIPPGAADVVHYRFTVPPMAGSRLTLTAKLKYRKFDTRYLRLFMGDERAVNELPVTVMAEATQVLQAVDGETTEAQEQMPAATPASWQRWNDYGIGLFRKPGRGELRQAEAAFQEVANLGSWHGEVNLARVYLREGRVDDAADALSRAISFDSIDFPWVVTWLRAQVDFQNGFLDEAIAGYEAILNTQFQEARDRGFDFSQDYRVWDQLGQALLERSKLARGRDPDGYQQWVERAGKAFIQALELDPERASSHYGLVQVYQALQDTEKETRHRLLHETYRVDDNAADRAIALARALDPVARRTSDDVVIYDLLNTPPGIPLAEPEQAKGGVQDGTLISSPAEESP